MKRTTTIHPIANIFGQIIESKLVLNVMNQHTEMLRSIPPETSRLYERSLFILD